MHPGNGDISLEMSDGSFLLSYCGWPELLADNAGNAGMPNLMRPFFRRIEKVF
jgi:hypothetical protein